MTPRGQGHTQDRGSQHCLQPDINTDSTSPVPGSHSPWHMGQLLHADMGYTQATSLPSKGSPGPEGHGGALSLAPQVVRLALLSNLELGLGTVSGRQHWRGEASLLPFHGTGDETRGYIQSPTHTLLLSGYLPTSSLSPVASHPPPGLQVEEVEGIPGPIPPEGCSWLQWESYSSNVGCMYLGF